MGGFIYKIYVASTLFPVWKNKTNHPISSKSHPSATANEHQYSSLTGNFAKLSNFSQAYFVSSRILSTRGFGNHACHLQILQHYHSEVSTGWIDDKHEECATMLYSQHSNNGMFPCHLKSESVIFIFHFESGHGLHGICIITEDPLLFISLFEGGAYCCR